MVIGRKNWLFAGSQEGAKNAAILFSVIVSCKLHGVDPFAYLKDVVIRIHTHPADLITSAPRREPRDHETRCRKCGYILKGITEPRCPECGERIPTIAALTARLKRMEVLVAKLAAGQNGG